MNRMYISPGRFFKGLTYVLLSTTAFVLAFVTGKGSDQPSKEMLLSSISTQVYADSPSYCASDTGCASCGSACGCASSSSCSG